MCLRRGSFPPCEECEHKAPSVDDTFLWVLSKCGGSLFDGFGGINTGAVMDIMRAHKVPSSEWSFIMDQVIIYASELRARKSKNE